MKNQNMMKFKILLLGIVFLPSLVMMIGHASSQALGLLIAITPLLIEAFFDFLLKLQAKISWHTSKFITGIVVLVSFVLLHYFIVGSFFLLEQDDTRILMSCLTFIMLIIAAKKISQHLSQLNQHAFTSSLQLIMVVLVLNALISLSGIDFFGNASPKPCFLFSEPSHFALASAPFLTYYAVSRSRFWITLLIFFSVWAVYIENLTMIIVVFIAYGATINAKKLLLACSIIVLIGLLSPNLNYYIERIDLSSNTNNLSALVFMQGWQNAVLSLQQTMGLGVGFQQFGYASNIGEITTKIQHLTGNNFNLFDGGTTASKLLGEFGFFGVGVILLLTYRAAKSLILINKNRKRPNIMLFAHCINISLMVELFIRGNGYFSQGLFLYLAFYFYEKNNRTFALEFIEDAPAGSRRA